MWWAKSAPGSVNQGFRDRRIGKFGATLRLSGREKKFEQQKGLYEKVLRIWEIMCVIFSRDDPSWTFGRSPSWKWRQLQHWNMPTRAEVTLGICILLLCLCLVMCTVIVFESDIGASQPKLRRGWKLQSFWFSYILYRIFHFYFQFKQEVGQ